MDKNVYSTIAGVTALFSLVASFITGLLFGMQCWPIFIIIANFLGGFSYFFIKDETTGKRDLQLFPAITFGLIVIFLVVLAFGSCMGSYTKSTGDKLLEKYEITGSYY